MLSKRWVKRLKIGRTMRIYRMASRMIDIEKEVKCS